MSAAEIVNRLTLLRQAGKGIRHSRLVRRKASRSLMPSYTVYRQGRPAYSTPLKRAKRSWWQNEQLKEHLVAWIAVAILIALAGIAGGVTGR